MIVNNSTAQQVARCLANCPGRTSPPCAVRDFLIGCIDRVVSTVCAGLAPLLASAGEPIEQVRSSCLIGARKSGLTIARNGKPPKMGALFSAICPNPGTSTPFFGVINVGPLRIAEPAGGSTATHREDIRPSVPARGDEAAFLAVEGIRSVVRVMVRRGFVGGGVVVIRRVPNSSRARANARRSRAAAPHGS